jgi:hypothetical protein
VDVDGIKLGGMKIAHLQYLIPYRNKKKIEKKSLRATSQIRQLRSTTPITYPSGSLPVPPYLAHCHAPHPPDHRTVL